MSFSSNFSVIIEHFRWYYQLFMRLTKIKPKCSLYILIITLVSQALQLASFLLPLKMLFVLGKDQFNPINIHYFIHFTIESKVQLATLFSIAIGMIIVISIWVEKSLNYRKSKCSTDIWRSMNKLPLYANQEKIATELYTQYFRGLAGLSMSFVIMGVLLFIYPMIFTAFLFYIVGAVLFVSLSSMMRKVLYKDFNKTINTLSMFAVFIIFVIVVIDLISDNPSGEMIHALISFVLLRRMIGSIKEFIQNNKKLYAQKDKLIALFFKKHTNSIRLSNPKKGDFWSLFEKDDHKHWIPKVVEPILENKTKIKKIQWFELGISSEIAFELKTDNGNYLLKLFRSNHSTTALNEVTLLKSVDIASFTLELVGSNTYKGFSCHLFILPDYSRPTQEEFDKKRLELLEKLALLPLSSRFIKQYRATYKLLHERLYSTLNRVRIAATEQDKLIIEAFENKFSLLVQKIEALPLQLVFSEFTVQNCILVDQKLKLLSFGDWEVGPLGAAFSNNEEEKKVLYKITAKESQKDVELILLLKEFEHYYKKNDFKEIIMLMKECIDTKRIVE